ncbi:MAG: flagellar biosynthesis anti-sigma factor FlgM [Acidobacteriales bacterium 59-55]|nr:flagellar biosynthesis anti-sigma factor FlgM [Terriglobales bacterium]OJV41331.1 MAG: flagellar biosynthesis anti-sigma factor FlgM [Acidobacteriales bacterium 59-55]
MSYTNGVGGLQQLLSSMTSKATQPAEPASLPRQSGAAAAHSSGENRVDQTSLSSASGLIAHALEGSDVRTEKVTALQQAIASGSYRVSSADVADKMIPSLLE